MLIAFGGFASLACLALPAGAVNPSEMLKDPILEARARQLSQGLRCVVCQNQSIDDSNAPLAQDLRILLRERIAAGDSDSQAVGFLVSRYGNFVLLKPPLQANTIPLWAGPAVILMIASVGAGWWLRTRNQPNADSEERFTSEDQKRLDELLQKDPVS
jgi:cytochrome c-type biogenesis protein CcmH